MLTQSMHATTAQQLQLTPKLQQAIHLLQLSTQQLTQQLQQMILSNIHLEMEETPIEIEDSTPCSFRISHSSSDGNTSDLLERCCQPSNSLQDHLLWQLRCMTLDDSMYVVGTIIVDSINDNGFLEATPADIVLALSKQNIRMSNEKIEEAIKLVQSFDPIGVGARNLAEALMLQLNQLSISTPGLSLAKCLIAEHIEWLGEHKYHRICQHYKIMAPDLEEALHLIQSLNPRPGNKLSPVIPNYIIPDVIVEKKSNRWVVALNPIVTPKLYLNQQYTNLAERSQSDDSKKFIHEQLHEARWLIKCLYTRNETLLKVAARIMKHQQGFLDYGVGAMKPLVLQKIATDLNLHQSTISRITTQKYIQTPLGTFELKYFFTSHLETSYGAEYSALAIQKYIEEIIRKEDKQKPLSDINIAKKLKGVGISVARRTIVKYRDLLAIPAARFRKCV